MDGLKRIIQLIFDPRSLDKLKNDGQKSLDGATDPKVPTNNLKKVETAFGNLGTTIKRLLPVLSFGAIARSVINNTRQSESALAQLRNQVNAAGTAAGFTTDQLVKFSQELAALSTTSVDVVQGGLQRLLAYSNVQGDAFTRAAQAALDMSEALGIDMVSASETLGAALDDPINGLGRLARQNFRFTDSEKAVIAALVEANDLFGAQMVILDTIEDFYAGAAEAARDTLGGAINALNQALKDQLTLSQASTGALADGINLVTANMRTLFRVTRDLIVVLGAFGLAKALNAARLGFIAVQTAAAAANLSLLAYLRTLRVVQIATGPTGWLTLAISTIALQWVRLRDATNEARQAQEDFFRRREEAQRSSDVDVVRRALTDAQESLARLRQIEREQRQARRATTAAFKAKLAEEEAAVAALSAQYIELLTRRDEALGIDTGAGAGGGEAGQRRGIPGINVGALLGLDKPELEAEQIRRFAASLTPIVTQATAQMLNPLTRARNEMLEAQKEALLHSKAMADSIAESLTRPFEDFFYAMAMGWKETGSMMDGFVEGLKGFGRSVAAELADGQAELQIAEGTAKLATGTWPPNAAAIKAASLHFAAAGLYRAIAGVSRGGFGGRGQDAVPTRQIDTRLGSMQRQQPEINIYIDPLNPSNPAWQSNLAQTLRGVTQRYGTATVNVRPRTA
jgi:DNA-binding MltR family transcriptional regulator